MGMLDDIKSKLTSITSNIYIGDMPDTPNDILALFLSGGQDPIETMQKDKIIYQPSFQIRARATSYLTAISYLQQAKTLLKISNEVINGTNYTITQQSDILPLGRDTKLRWDFSLNFSTKII